MPKGLTKYSDEILGSKGNYKQAVTFDKTDGFIGISQRDDNGVLMDRVLLSPEQVQALIKFAND